MLLALVVYNSIIAHFQSLSRRSILDYDVTMNELDRSETLIYELVTIHAQNYHTLKKLLGRFARVVNARVTPQQQFILEYLSIYGIRSIDEISRQINRARPTVIQMLQRMTNNGLVRRIKQPDDRKIYYEALHEIQNKVNIHTRITVAKTIFDDFTFDELQQFLIMESKFGESLNAKLTLDDDAFKKQLPEEIVNQHFIDL